jgi:hypothetical protein
MAIQEYKRITVVRFSSLEVHDLPRLLASEAKKLYTLCKNELVVRSLTLDPYPAYQKPRLSHATHLNIEHEAYSGMTNLAYRFVLLRGSKTTGNVHHEQQSHSHSVPQPPSHRVTWSPPYFCEASSDIAILLVRETLAQLTSGLLVVGKTMKNYGRNYGSLDAGDNG